MPRSKSLGDFDVITGPPAAPASLQKPADPPPQRPAARAGDSPPPAKPAASGRQ